MAKPLPPRPTDAELAILNVLWTRGPATVRDVHADLAALRPIGYTTVLKLLQIMTEKGLVQRDESRRTHVYSASRPAERTRRQLVQDLLERAFSGSASQLVMQALASQKTSAAELAEIRKLIDQIERGEK